MKARVLLPLAGLMAYLALAGPAAAATTVANQNDSGPGSLREAIATAASGETISVPAGTYTLTSEPLAIAKSVTISGHSSGDTILRAGGAFGVLRIIGPLNATISGVTIRDGAVSSPAEGGGIFAAKADLTLDNDVVTHNRGTADGAPGASGGSVEGAGIWVAEGSLNLNGTQVTENTASAAGGSGENGGTIDGIGVWSADGPVTISGATISGNRGDARGGQGPDSGFQNGGITEGGGVWIGEGSASIVNTTVSGNSLSAVGGPGAHGGIAEGTGVWVDADTTISGLTVAGNVADIRGGPGSAAEAQFGGVGEGGGIWAAEKPLRISGTTVTENAMTAVGGNGAHGGVLEGGGVWAAVPQTSIDSTTVEANRLDGRGGQGPEDPKQTGGSLEGGGLWLDQEGKAAGPSIVTGSAIVGNVMEGSAGPGAHVSSVEGGGVFAIAGSAAVSFAKTTIASNIARASGGVSGGDLEGGGFFGLPIKSASLTLTAMTIASNRLETSGGPVALSGGNLFAARVALGDSIVAGGFGSPGSENCSITEGTSLGFNIDSTDQCGFHAAGDQVNRDPQLGPLQDNGGPTQTMAPASGGPAIDQGASFGLTSDQRGVIRPIDFPSIPNSTAPGADGSDIGAYELRPSNAFKLGKLKKNNKKGTATLIVMLPQPSYGSLVLKGKGLKRLTKTITGQAKVKLKIAAIKGAAKALRKKGRRKVKLDVIYAPTGNDAASKLRAAKLVRKHRRPKGA